MHLSDRGGGDRLTLQLEEEARRREAELLLDDLLHLLEGERADVRLEEAQLGDDVRRHDVRAHREQLAELDERRAELLEELAEVDAAAAPAGRGSGARGRGSGRRGGAAR